MPASPYVSYAANSPMAQKGYAAIAAKTLPKSAGWKAASGVKGGAIGVGTSIAANYLKTKNDPIIEGAYGNITNKYQRRLQDAGPGYASAMINRAGQGAQYGGWYGAAAGAAAGAVEAAIKKHAPTAYSDFKPQDMNGLITDAYRQYLGRDPEAGLVDNWMRGQGWKPGDKGVGQKQVFEELDSIKNSPEAQAYANRGISTAPTNMPTQSFTPSAIPSSFLSPEKVAMIDDIRRRQLGY